MPLSWQVDRFQRTPPTAWRSPDPPEKQCRQRVSQVLVCVVFLIYAENIALGCKSVSTCCDVHSSRTQMPPPSRKFHLPCRHRALVLMHISSGNVIFLQQARCLGADVSTRQRTPSGSSFLSEADRCCDTEEAALRTEKQCRRCVSRYGEHLLPMSMRSTLLSLTESVSTLRTLSPLQQMTQKRRIRQKCVFYPLEDVLCIVSTFRKKQPSGGSVCSCVHY